MFSRLPDAEKKILTKFFIYLIILFVGTPVLMAFFTVQDGRPIASIIQWDYLRGILLMAAALTAVVLWALGPIVLMRALTYFVRRLFNLL